MIDPLQFVSLVQPLLEARDLSGLVSLLKTRWDPDELQALLRSKHLDAKKVALLALALVGPSCCIPDLTEQLKDADPVVAELAEHALWSIWIRSGRSCEANKCLSRGADAMEARDLPAAVEHFNKAIRLDPDFAEAYNQRAIAYYLQEQYEQSIGDCRRVVKRMPCHFGAWAGLGHCHAHLGNAREAIASYEKALEINPRLDCVRETVGELKNRLDAAGE